jgi:hypothetical protein
VKGDKLHAKTIRQQYAAALAYFLGVRSPPMDQPERPTLRLDMLLTAHNLLRITFASCRVNSGRCLRGAATDTLCRLWKMLG